MLKRLILLLPLLLAACHHKLSPQDVDVTGLVPPLSLQMTDVNTGQPITASALQGHVVLLYFGYTNCPDVCPATLYNLTKIFSLMGPAAANLRVLFVTVDPTRDTAPVLAQYVGLFGPQFIGVRGTADQLYSLARRYRVVFSVSHDPYTVTHSAAVYVFGKSGRARFLIAGLDTNKPDFQGIAADIAEVATN